MVKVFDSPWSFVCHVGQDLMINGVDIYNKAKDAVDQYGNENWLEFGVDIGEAAAKTLLGEESQA